MNTQKSTTPNLKNDLKDFRHDLRVLRDEMRLKVHLAGMDLKQEWEVFEPQLERAINEAAVVGVEAVADLKKRAIEFRKKLS